MTVWLLEHYKAVDTKLQWPHWSKVSVAKNIQSKMITTISIEWWKVKILDTINPGCRNFYRLHKTLPTICIHCPPPSNPTLVHTNHTLLAITGHLYQHMALSNTHKHTRESFTHSHRHTHTLDALIWCMFAHTLTTHLVWASERAQQTHPAKKNIACTWRAAVSSGGQERWSGLEKV